MAFRVLLSSTWLLTITLYSCSNRYPVIQCQTAMGNFEIEIYVDRAPVTAANFIKYVQENRFNDAKFYRVVRDDNQPDNPVKIDVIQGGLFEDEHPLRLPPIAHETTLETGIRHVDGVISMARLEPGTASSEFFICVGDQPELDYGGRRNNDGQGFAAFGRVIKGLNVVKLIHQQNAKEQYFDPPIKIYRFVSD